MSVLYFYTFFKKYKATNISEVSLCMHYIIDQLSKIGTLSAKTYKVLERSRLAKRILYFA